METAFSNIETQNIDHLGIIAAMTEKYDIKALVNSFLGEDARITGTVSAGECVKAMILNGLGFKKNPLYMVSNFFRNKPVDLLFGRGVNANDFNDDNLGATLDAIAKKNPSHVFGSVALSIAKKFNLYDKLYRIDSTSFSVEGRYEGFGDEEGEGSHLIKVAYGHSKDRRPDLKQVMLSLVTTGNSMCFWAEPHNGNSSDTVTFSQTIRRVREFQKQFDFPDDNLFVGDSALYNKDGILSQNEFKWLTRVPETLKEAKTAIAIPDAKYEWTALEDGYKYTELQSEYGGIKQRWLLIFSLQAYKREKQTFLNKITSGKETLEKALWHLGNKKFACEPDAVKAFNELVKKYPYFSVNYEITSKPKYGKKGKPTKNAKPTENCIFISGIISENKTEITAKLETFGRFILATNDLDKSFLLNSAMLTEYKNLQVNERGFRMLKDPWFLADEIFIKTPDRIAALMCVMALCLMIYNLAEKHMRDVLKATGETLPNQLNKQIQTPTMRWIFCLLDGISRVIINNASQQHLIIANIDPLKEKIIRIFGPEAIRIYGLKDL